MSRIGVLLVLATLLLPPHSGFAQEAAPQGLPPGWITPTPKGFVAEPALLRKLVGISESTVGDEKEPADGLYVETGNMITGEGSISAGPGYRRHLLDDRMLIDVSAAVSWKLYNVVQASIELPHLARPSQKTRRRCRSANPTRGILETQRRCVARIELLNRVLGTLTDAAARLNALRLVARRIRHDDRMPGIVNRDHIDLALSPRTPRRFSPAAS